MLNAWDAHKIGVDLDGIGAMPSRLADSTAFELSSNIEKHLETIHRNEELIAEADGMLAPINGKERFSSTATSHTFALLRAGQAGHIVLKRSGATSCLLHPGILMRIEMRIPF